MSGVQHMYGGMAMKELFVYDLEVRGQRSEVRKKLFSSLWLSSLISGNEKGFLLLEHLIAIVIMGVLSIAFFSLMQVVSLYAFDQTSLTMHEVNSLAIRLQNEIRFANSLTAADGQLFAHFTNEGNIVSFSAQNNRLVRQVGGRGGEIMVYNLAGMDIVLFDNQSARVSLRSFNGDVFQFYLHILSMEVDREISEEDINDEG